MDSDPIRVLPRGASPYVQPMLHTLNQMYAQETLRPEQLGERARALLADRLGPSEAPVEVAFAHGSLGLIGTQTHYSPGYALLLTLPQGAAVAVRARAEAGVHVAMEEAAPEAARLALHQAGERLAHDVAQRFAPAGSGLEVAVVVTVPAACVDAYVSAIAVAVVRGVHALLARPEPPLDVVDALGGLAERGFGLAYGLAPLIGAVVGTPRGLVLVDTARREHLAVELPRADVLGLALVDLGGGLTQPPAFYRERRTQTEAARVLLRQQGFAHLDNFAELEHRDLQRALQALPPDLRPLVRHLVTENARVTRLVAAARRHDWQMFGVLLLMSHASLRADWLSTSPEVDFAVAQVEAQSLEGLYGACQAGRGACLLVVGKPFQLPAGLDRLRAATHEAYPAQPEALAFIL